jgi:TPR repeat protein
MGESEHITLAMPAYCRARRCLRATRLAGMYYNGQSVQRDYAEAANWVRRAAEQGYAPAQAYLGIMYWNGQGGPPAHEPGAVGVRDEAASKMTPDEIAEAQRMAQEWKPKGRSTAGIQ